MGALDTRGWGHLSSTRRLDPAPGFSKRSASVLGRLSISSRGTEPFHAVGGTFYCPQLNPIEQVIERERMDAAEEDGEGSGSVTQHIMKSEPDPVSPKVQAFMS